MTSITQIICLVSTFVAGYGTASKDFNIIAGGVCGLAISVMMFSALNETENDTHMLQINTNNSSKPSVLATN